MEYRERGPIWDMMTAFPIEELYALGRYAAQITVVGALVVGSIFAGLKAKEKIDEDFGRMSDGMRSLSDEIDYSSETLRKSLAGLDKCAENLDRMNRDMEEFSKYFSERWDERERKLEQIQKNLEMPGR